jgi:hypothetical protein
MEKRMNKDEIKKMVVQLSGCDMPEDDSPALKMFIDFANMVAEHERNACAELCEMNSHNSYDMAKVLEEAIRARGQE